MSISGGIDLETLAERILEEKCTPFLGAGAASGLLPTARELSNNWIKEYQLPIPQDSPLDYVAQMISVKWDAMKPKEILARELRNTLKRFDIASYEGTYKILSRINTRIFVTTNYDDLLESALKENDKNPTTIICPWHCNIDPLDEIKMPTIYEPWVYHLHGFYAEPESMVLTEDDYTDFLVHVLRRNVLHHMIERALSGTTLLFLGYSLKDVTFRVLFRGLISARVYAIRRKGVTVQLNTSSQNKKGEGIAYSEEEHLKLYEKYFNDMNFSVFWMDIKKFLQELESEIFYLRRKGHCP